MRRMCRRRWRLRARYSAHRAGALACTEIRPRAACAGMAEAWQQRREQGKRKKSLRALFCLAGRGMGRGREQEAKTGREQMQGTVLIQATEHRGTGFLPFFAKRKRKRRGGQASVPLHPLLPGEGSPRTPPRGEGVLRFWRDDAAWTARPYTAPGLLRQVRRLGG